MLAAGPELRITGAAAQTRMVSVARIRLVSRKSPRLFKGIICDDISEFESHMPSQAVRSLSASGMKGSQSSGLLSRLRVAFSDSGKGRTDSAGIYFRRGAYWFEWTEAPTCLYQGQFPRGAPSFVPIAERFIQ